MSTQRIKHDYAADVVRWMARLIGTVLFLLVVWFAAGEGMPAPGTLSLTEGLLFLAFAIMVVGLLVAWYWERVGGLMVIGGFLAFWLINAIATGNYNPGWLLIVFPLTGLLFLLSWWRERLTRQA
ncbi:MAG: hypothetical protein Fur0021_07220 [Candidatus Promineifilaceae bacterium]